MVADRIVRSRPHRPHTMRTVPPLEYTIGSVVVVFRFGQVLVRHTDSTEYQVAGSNVIELEGRSGAGGVSGGGGAGSSAGGGGGS